jgi:hypothetical protein
MARGCAGLFWGRSQNGCLAQQVILMAGENLVDFSLDARYFAALNMTGSNLWYEAL